MSSNLAIDFKCYCKGEGEITYYEPGRMFSSEFHFSRFPMCCYTCATKRNNMVPLLRDFEFYDEAMKNLYIRKRNEKFNYLLGVRNDSESRRQQQKAFGNLKIEKFDDIDETDYMEPAEDSLTNIGYIALSLVISYLEFRDRKHFCSMNRRLEDYFIRSDFTNLRINLTKFILKAAFPQKTMDKITICETKDDILKRIEIGEPLQDKYHSSFHDNLFLIMGMHGSFCTEIKTINVVNRERRFLVEYSGLGIGVCKMGDIDGKKLLTEKVKKTMWIKKGSRILTHKKREHMYTFGKTNLNILADEADFQDLPDVREEIERDKYFDYYNYDEDDKSRYSFTNPFNDNFIETTVTVCNIVVRLDNGREIILNKYKHPFAPKCIGFDENTGNHGPVHFPREIIYIKNPMFFRGLSRNPFFAEKSITKRREAIVGRINLFALYRTEIINGIQTCLKNYFKKDFTGHIDAEIKLMTHYAHLLFIERFIGHIGETYLESEKLANAFKRIRAIIDKFRQNPSEYYGRGNQEMSCIKYDYIDYIAVMDLWEEIQKKNMEEI